MICGKKQKRMMDEKFFRLVEKLEKTSGLQNFFDELQNYFSENFSTLNFDIIKVFPFPPFYMKLNNTEIDKSLLSILAETQNVDHINKFLVVNDYYIFLINENFASKYLLIFKNAKDSNLNELDGLCDYINSLFKLALNNYHFGLDESDLQNANLISQMNHDINSMNSLIKTNSSEIDESVLNKMSYIEKMTKDVLLYVREIQIIDSEVKIEELLQGVIQNIAFPATIEVSTRYHLKERSIKLDVELFNRALSEILLNAISSLENKEGNINIETNLRQVKNLFYNDEYLELIVKDNGAGINTDFISFLKNPFFTTKKSDHHSGLGLSIADKIINAHGGRLNIETIEDNKTKATVYLPLQGKYNE
jgi:signal transduction histidine kinase